jgi:hypothetical protein
MSQQSEFEYSQQASREGQPINTDPREQNQSYPTDNVGAQPMGGQKIYPQGPRPHRRRRWLWLLLILIVILALLSGGGYFSNSVFSKSQTLAQQSFTVAGTPNLVINDAAGGVRIHQGSGSQIVIDATAHGGLFANLSNDTVEAKQSGNTVNILVGEAGDVLNHGTVDLDITLPANSNIQATVNAGGLDINGISGQMNLKVEAGALNFENGTLEGQSLLKNNAGAINFNGSITAGGNYDFENDAGAINLTLPSDVPFTLDASSQLGKVNNDFGSTTIGSNPTAQVHAHTDVGAVNIHER